ncbi:hypothetical protein [Cryobacterium sp. M15]|nr:hypothetical protein [Cryobacterium sp. M15]
MSPLTQVLLRVPVDGVEAQVSAASIAQVRTVIASANEAGVDEAEPSTKL